MAVSVSEHIPLPLIRLTGYSPFWMLDKLCQICDLTLEYDELIVLDPDVIVRRDVQEVFNEDFDVAMYPRCDKQPDHRYNGGVVFSRSRKFWEHALEILEVMPPEQQRWMGDQVALNQAARKFRVYDLPEKYNSHPVKGSGDASIVHYKGTLKRFM